MLHQLFSKLGIYWSRHQYMPRGIDWVWDLRRLNIICEAPTVFDIGANVGQTTSEILKVFPRASVHAFEPVQATFDIFQKKFGLMAGIRCNRLAVSDSCGQASLHSSADSQLSHIAAPTEHLMNRSSHLEAVEKITVDAYCAKHGIHQINILKTDTEGHDLAVLKGASHYLSAGKIDWVLTEATFDPLDENHSQFRMIDSFMMQCGMEVYCFYDQYFKDGGQHHMFCNVMFVRKDLSTV